MSAAPAHLAVRFSAVVGLTLLGAAVVAACDDGDESAPATDTPEATAEGTRPTPDESLTLASERGEAPVYWRTEDNFRSLQAGKPYKVLFRVTNGYEEGTLPIAASCSGCRGMLKLEATRADAVGAEVSGSFYPFSLELPSPGMWQLTVVAGDARVTIPVVAQPAG